MDPDGVSLSSLSHPVLSYTRHIHGKINCGIMQREIRFSCFFFPVFVLFSFLVIIPPTEGFAADDDDAGQGICKYNLIFNN